MGITDFSFFHLFIHLIFAKKVKMGKRVFFFFRSNAMKMLGFFSFFVEDYRMYLSHCL